MTVIGVRGLSILIRFLAFTVGNHYPLMLMAVMRKMIRMFVD